MPTKPPQKGRAWGTRFDPLPSSPPPSPRSRAVVPQNGFDQVPDQLLNKKDEKMSHDASIFVGSLPCNVDKQELARMLSEHLSEHGEIKNIKVVRDSRGGVCAFVQCEDASSAARLIRILHSSDHRPFLGRTLRYEPARAFRALLISYRAPIQYAPPETLDADPDVNREGRVVELQLPTSMALCRPWRTKFTTIYYNTGTPDENQLATSPPGPSAYKSTLYLNPLLFDAETIRKLSAYFGSLEYFGPYNADGVPSSRGQSSVTRNETGGTASSEHAWKSYPVPHDAPRSFGMDPGCWEVKWDHRDDCVGALMTLRRVPHLTVTWAHQPSSSGFDNHSPTVPYQNLGLGHPNAVRNTYQSHEHVAGYSIHPRGGMSSHSKGLSNDLDCGPSDDQTLGSLKSNSVNKNQSIGDTWGLAASNSYGDHLNPDPGSPLPLRGSPTFTLNGKGRNAPEAKGLQGGILAGNTMPSNSEITRSRSSASQITSLSLAADGIPAFVPADARGVQHESDMPPTPDLERSPNTPKTPGSMPDTPDGYDFQTLMLSRKEGHKNPTCEAPAADERELDPTTIFVGGLEMFGPSAWDEEKIQNFFTRFGVVENVKFIRPASGRSAFAFVKFTDTEAAARAVLEEHNRIHDGRQMRVQLRDCNPPHRGSWRYNRGRGRSQHYTVQRHHSDSGGRTANVVPRMFLQDQGHEATTEPYIFHIGNSSSVSVPDFPPPSRGPADFVDDPSTSGGLESQVQAMKSHPSSPDSAARGQLGDFRSWYEDPAFSGVTPESSSFGSSASAVASNAPPFVSYPMPYRGYYPVQPWMQPIPQQYPYPVSYMSGYPPSFPSGAASDAGTVLNAWNSMGSVYTPYMHYPVQLPGDPSQAQYGNCPLIPTGFIHGEQGTLIPVYHPEALDQYMATVHHGAPPMVQPQAPPYPIPGPSYPIPQQGFQANPTVSQVNMGWNPGSMQPAYPPQYLQPDFGQGSMASAISRGGYPVKQDGHANPSPFRKAQRRDQQNGHNGNRNNARGNVNRGGRGGGPVRSPKAVGSPQTPQLMPLTGEWGAEP